MRDLLSPRSLLALALVLGSPLAAEASQTFPGTVQQAVPQLGCAPQCTLCHNTNPGTPPANKPFALNLKKAMLVVPQNTDSLRSALQALQAQGAASDADADGIGDFDELLSGTDPNVSNVTDPSAAICETVPLYGCGARIAPASSKRTADPMSLAAAALTALAGLFVLRRRRRA